MSSQSSAPLRRPPKRELSHPFPALSHPRINPRVVYWRSHQGGHNERIGGSLCLDWSWAQTLLNGPLSEHETKTLQHTITAQLQVAAKTFVDHLPNLSSLIPFDNDITPFVQNVEKFSRGEQLLDDEFKKFEKHWGDFLRRLEQRGTNEASCKREDAIVVMQDMFHVR